MDVTDENGVFRQQLGRLLSNYGLSDPGRVEPIALNFTEAALREGWEEDLFEQTCRWVSWHIDPPFPGLAKFREVYRVHKAERDARVVAESLALPVPKPETAEVDQTDPFSSTPEERRRWAREDSWLRGYALTLPVQPVEAGDEARDAWERNYSVSLWPRLRPDQRRAKERRIAAEKAQAMALTEAAAAAQRARREVALANRRDDDPPPASDVREIVWSDGVISRVRVSPSAGDWTFPAPGLRAAE